MPTIPDCDLNCCHGSHFDAINMYYENIVAALHCASTLRVKKTRHQTLGHNFTNYYPIFKFFFTLRLYSKFATNSCLNIPPNFKHVATLPCEI